MRCLVVAMTLVASTVLVHGQHWTALARRGVIRTYRATGRAWRCWAFLSSDRPASATKPPSPTKSLLLPREAPSDERERRLLRRVERSLERLRQAAAPNLVARRSAERQVSSVDGRGRETDRGDSQRSARTTERPRERWSARPVHLTRRFRIDDAHWQLERQPDHPGTWPRRDPQRDDPRGARRLPRWATARWCRHRRVHG